MKPTRHNIIITFLYAVGCISILVSVIALTVWLNGGILGYVRYIEIISASLINGLLLLGFAVLLNHQSDIEHFQYEQSKILKEILENTKSAENTSNETSED